MRKDKNQQNKLKDAFLRISLVYNCSAETIPNYLLWTIYVQIDIIDV